jgi:hypothetical protein
MSFRRQDASSRTRAADGSEALASWRDVTAAWMSSTQHQVRDLLQQAPRPLYGRRQAVRNREIRVVRFGALDRFLLLDRRFRLCSFGLGVDRRRDCGVRSLIVLVGLGRLRAGRAALGEQVPRAVRGSGWVPLPAGGARRRCGGTAAMRVLLSVRPEGRRRLVLRVRCSIRRT